MTVDSAADEMTSPSASPPAIPATSKWLASSGLVAGLGAVVASSCLCHSARTLRGRRGRERSRRPRDGRWVAHSASGRQRLRHCRGMGRLVVEASGSLRFAYGLRLVRAISRDAGAVAARLSYRGAGCELEPHRPCAAEVLLGAVNATRIDDNLPGLRPSGDRDDADRRLPVLLCMQGMWGFSQAEGRGLLRLLLLRRRAVPADPGGESA
jgi:hypothetical protein